MTFQVDRMRRWRERMGKPFGRAWLVAAIACLVFAGADAQQSTNPSDILQQLRQGATGLGGVTNQGPMPQQTVLEPTAPPALLLPTSRLEQILSSRAGVRLRQFGYDQLGVGQAVVIPQVGAVQDSYVLGPGDEIVVTLRGQENAEYRTTVNRDGMVTLPRLSPISAGGRTLGDFRRDLVSAIHRAYVATDGFVTIGQVRQVSVLVSGEVNSPGNRILTGLSTPADAVMVSGGVKKTGSLRNIYILRGGKRISVDLYSVLTGHAQQPVALADGDKIVVPPLGRTAAVTGWVRRPGIYELAPGRASLSIRELLDLAGGLEVRGKYRLSVLRVAPDGTNQLVELKGEGGIVGDSDILFAQPEASRTVDSAILSGGTALAGKLPVTSGTKLSAYLKQPGALGDNPYTLLGVISRRDPNTLLRTLIPFTPVAVLRGSQDMIVQSDDIIRVISAREARILSGTIRRYMNLQVTSEEARRSPQIPASLVPGQIGKQQSLDDADIDADRKALAQAERDEEAAQMTESGMRSSPLRGQVTSPAISDQLSLTSQQPAGAALPQMQNQNQYLPQDFRQANPDGTLQGPVTQTAPVQGQTPYNGYYQGINPPYGAYNPYAPNAQQMIAQDREAAANFEDQPNRLGDFSTNREITRLSQLANQLRIDPMVLANFLSDRSLSVDGAVQGPGLYLVGPDADIQSLLLAAGGMSRWADKSSVEVLSTSIDPNNGRSQTVRRVLALSTADAGYILSPRDDVHVNEVYTVAGIGAVKVQGQVRHTGTYQIIRGEHLSDLLMRAGGLTESAYPYGTVFLRDSAAQRERDAFQREGKEIEDQLLLAMSRRDPNAKLSPDAFVALQSYVSQIRNQKPLGRVTVVADPAVLAANPALDPLLEPGDVVFVPQRPFSVSVLGEVLQPGSVPFRPDMSPSDYIKMAGGYSPYANESAAILVLPDGSARPLESGWFSSGQDVPPGSTIFVSRDVSGIDMHQIIVDTTAIVSQLATSAAALAVLSTQIK